MKPHNLHGVAGLAERTKHPDTGCTMSLYVAEQAGLDADETWVAVCETHGSMVGARSRAQGRESLENPEWCEECAEALEIKMQPNGKLVLRDPMFDATNTTALSRSRLRAMRGPDFESAIVSAGNFAKKQNTTCYVYRGNSFGHTVFRSTKKKSDALSPINNTGQFVWEVTPDLQVIRYSAERDDMGDELEPNPASQLEWVKGPGVDRDGHSLTWWKNKAARQKSQYDRMTVFIQVLCWDRTGASTRDWPQFDPGELKEAKAWAKEFVETTGGSCQVEGRVTIPYQGSVTIPLGEWKNNASNGWYVWSVDGKTFVPVSRNGPFQDQDEAIAVAKQMAKGGGTYDAVITFGGDPEASDFEIWKSFKAWSGEVHYTTDLPKVGGRLREYP